MKLQEKCDFCSAIAEVASEFQVGAKRVVTFTCGHAKVVEKSESVRILSEAINRSLNLEPVEMGNGEIHTHVSAFDSGEPVLSHSYSGNLALVPARETKPTSIPSVYKSLDGEKTAYGFQIEGVEFLEAAGFTALIADRMGLGKTIQALLALKKHPDLFPCVVLVKSSTIFQWCREFKSWVSMKFNGVMPIVSKMAIFPGFDCYIMSMDTLSTAGTLEKLNGLGIKTVICDESQSFKNPSSKRTTSLIKFITANKIQNRIFLSGTPIKNRADEYFTVLNLIAPQHFTSLQQFKNRWLVANEKGSYTRIAPWRMEAFQELTKKWIIRRDEKDVLRDLPAFSREYTWINVEDERVKDTYNRELDLFEIAMSEGAMTSVDMLGWLARIRRITGFAKIQACVDWILEFLEETEEENEKIAIGIHHKDVRDVLYETFKARGYGVLKISGEDSAIGKDNTVTEFQRVENRVCIINMLAGGIGLNLQFCSHALGLERQWNAADEEQFEKRFHRNGQKNPVKVTYLLAAGTIDEYFSDMVEEKRKICGETLDWNFESDGTAMRDLAERVVAGRLR